LREDDDDGEYTIHAKQHMTKLFRQWRQIVKVDYEKFLGMNTPENKPRKVVCSSLVGFSEEHRAFLEESTVDLAKVINITFFLQTHPCHTHLQEANDILRTYCYFHGPGSNRCS